MLVSWICLRIIQASSCFPTWQEGDSGSGREKEREKRERQMGYICRISNNLWLRDSTSLTFKKAYTPKDYVPLIFFLFFNGSKWWTTQQWLILLQKVITLKQWTCTHQSPGFYFAHMSACLQQELWMTRSILFDQTSLSMSTYYLNLLFVGLMAEIQFPFNYTEQHIATVTTNCCSDSVLHQFVDLLW